MTQRKFGIEKIGVYPTALQLDLESLAKAREYDVEYMRKELMVEKRGVDPPWEDVVTMSVNAAKPILSDEDVQSIGLLIVATETGLDHEKAVSSWVFDYLSLPSICRHFELKVACYSGTAALKMAIGWLSSGLLRKGQKALVITTDESLNALNKPWEYVCGGGAVALLISDKPDFLEIEVEKFGVYAHEVADVIRPLPWLETGNSEHSLFSYMEALVETYIDFEEHVDDVIFNRYFNANVYHVPFSGISYRAHKQLMNFNSEVTDEEVTSSFRQKVLPSIYYTSKIGGTYGGSIFIALLATVLKSGIKENDRIGIFSYGSGSCAEFYCALATGRSKEVAAAAGLDNLLANRYVINVAQYEQMEKLREQRIKEADFTPDEQMVPGLFEAAYKDRGLLVYKGSKGYYRSYEFS